MAYRLSEHFPLRFTEWLMAGILTTWGIAAYNMGDAAWSVPALTGLARIASHQTWGAVVFVTGIVRLTALFINGAKRRTPHARMATAMVALFVWFQISLGMLTADAITTGLGVYPWLLLADLHNLSRATKDARFSDDKWRSREAGVHAQPT